MTNMNNGKPKALMLASVASMIDLFNSDNIDILLSLNYEVHVATNFNEGSITSQERVNKYRNELLQRNIKPFNIPIPRSLFKIKGIVSAYKQIKKIVNDNEYRIVHCHSPIGGVICRLACRKARKHGTKVIYTAHGFHFHKGAPLKNWLRFYPAEKLCAHFTDTLITINQEDYNLARKKMKAKSVEYVPGVGVDTSKFANVEIDRDKKRHELDIPVDKKLLISIGELSIRKNHEIAIRALSNIENVCYVVVGKGNKREYLEKLTNDLNLSDRVRLVGSRQDIGELLKASDLFVFPSFQEGLPVSLMEAMAVGLPVVCSNIRGNCDLIDENGGVLFDPHSVDDCKNAITKALNSNMADMGKYNQVKVSNFSYEKVHNQMLEIYKCLKAEL